MRIAVRHGIFAGVLLRRHNGGGRLCSIRKLDCRQGQIYATDNSSDLIKERLSVYGVTAEGEQVLLDPSDYVVHLGGADGATEGWTLSTTQLNSFTVTAGNLSAGFSAVAAAVAPGSVKVTPDFTVHGDKNVATDDGSTLYLYTHDNVKQHITVVGYNNDGRPYNGTVEASVITDYVISGSTVPGVQTLTVTWSFPPTLALCSRRTPLRPLRSKKAPYPKTLNLLPRWGILPLQTADLK